MPSDMLKWTLEGKLPYFAAFGDIDKQLGARSEACPISASRMFRPIQAISSQKLESMAAKIAQKIGLELPPVNFYAIASHYCRQLSLPTREILPLTCRMCEWCVPPELYLSSNEFKIPTRLCVMSILIVTIRILFAINGYGMWESSLSNPNCSSSGIMDKDTESQSHLIMSENAYKDSSSNNSDPFSAESDNLYSRLSVVELLQILKAKYNELDDVDAYFCDLEPYLQHCMDVVFSGSRPSYEDPEEEKLLELFWQFYQSNKGAGSGGMNNKGPGVVSDGMQKEVTETRGDQSSYSTSQNSDTSHHDRDSDRPSRESHKDEAIRQLKLDMEENKFCYIPPRVKVKRKDLSPLH
ncbi:hypothetical protein CDL12_04069 [Handroanthus impetiginosus]|uniref:Rrn7/TAF1B C-terminal cyclin domain-containing protein n=1 Tax=Handroanthus impetiginosus TaxID=429701 RepID=A0A2G9I0B7_9LAMI|nr:hypothetical protein CDL12_04069 [Handroanthus impetiginosus]